ncbi:hypothetical protein N7528_007357 [Penicillium herquei]|nr:hypothetical protein N7528_007357 [Penicillium herquei]
MPEPVFQLFPQLPAELRCMTWKYCLPHRVAELDPPFALLDGQYGRQVCASSHTTVRNSRLPVLAAVCQESRFIALQEGKWLEVNRIPGLKVLWIQPRRDVLHLNFTPERHDHPTMAQYMMRHRRGNMINPNSYDSSMVHKLLSLSHGTKTPPSIIADLIYPFHLIPLTNGNNKYDPRAGTTPGAYLRRSNEIIGLMRFANKLWNEEHVERSLDVTLVAVSLHVSQAVALRSGLFGLLGDEPIQMIDTDDHARLSKFEALYEEGTCTKEPHVEGLFESIKNERFEEWVSRWKVNAEWLILAHMWHMEVLGAENGEEPTFAWLPLLSEGEAPELNVEEHFPKNDDPWAMRARKIIPKLRPKIMVRLCTKKCHLEPNGTEGLASRISDEEKRFFQLEVRDIRSRSFF